MAHDDLLIAGGAAGATILIANGSGNLLIAPSTPEPIIVGGPSGGKSTQKGVSIFDQDRSLGERPVKKAPAKSQAKLIVRVESKSKGSILIPIIARAESIVTPRLGRGLSVSKLVKLERFESQARIKIVMRGLSEGYLDHNVLIARALHSIEKLKKLFKITMLSNYSETIDNIYQDLKPEKFKTFDFEESPEHWKGILTEQRFKAFTHSSSFVGNVRYDAENQGMRILLNGKPYNFCGVPERIFDSFMGADSKGAFFARNIKGQFDC